MTYKEHIYNVCKNTDLENKDDCLETIRYLAKELMSYQELALVQEAKMKEIMTAKDFEEWSTQEAKKMFKREIEMMEDSDYKQFCIDNFEAITEEYYA